MKMSDELRNVLAMCDMDLLQNDTKPSFQKLKTMVKKFLDQKSKVLILRPERDDRQRSISEKQRQGKTSQRRVQTRRMPSLEGKRQMYPVEMLAVFVMMDNVFQQVDRPEAAVLPGKGARDRAENNLREIEANPSCYLWHPPVCQNYKSQSGCKYDDGCSFLHREADQQPKRPRREVGKGNVAIVPIAKN